MRILILLLVLSNISIAQSPYDFSAAYNAVSSVPAGLLEAVAWTNTHMVHRDGTGESCSGIPQPIGLMGLHADGNGYFNPTAIEVATLSNISIQQQIADPNQQILAYALAFDHVLNDIGGNPGNPQDILEALHTLSEIPDTGFVNLLAKDMQVYSIMRFMNSNEYGQLYNFTPHHYNLDDVFGSTNHEVLSSPSIIFSSTGIKSKLGTNYTISEEKSLQYGPAIWNPAPSCNFSSRNGIAVSAITIHTVQGSYAGAISWAQNCTSNVSYHYVVRSSDGQITQMVLEEDKGWHVGSENPYTIGYEHEGFVDDPSWYTEPMYNASADLSRDIIASGYGIPAVRTYYGPASAGTNLLGGCTKIKGHQHYPNQTHTDPGIYWDWEKYYRLINNTFNPTIVSSASGTLYDTGGATGDYQDDEREFWLIEPANTASITLDFTFFGVESGYDNLFIYDGDSIDAPLIGSYTGSTSPGIITSTGGSLLLEFRSDCSTVSGGWEANYSTVPLDVTPPTTSIVLGQTWYTDDFVATFNDQDTQGTIEERYYLLAEKDNGGMDWFGNGQNGFALESFDVSSANWTNQTGTYSMNSGAFEITNVSEQNSNTYMALAQDNSTDFLYEWDQTITSSDVNQRAGIHFFCDDPTLPNRGNSYFVYLRENDNKVQVYSVLNDIFNLEIDVPYTIDQGVTYNCKVTFSPSSGSLKVFIDDTFVTEWVDPSPLQSGAYISLRTGGCDAQFDNIKVYRSRGTTALVTAGFTDELSIESENAISTGKIRSIVIDDSQNWSAASEEEVLLDFTAPTIDFLNDGAAVTDIDSFYTSSLEANWNAIDIHSAISNYEYAIGTLPNLDDIVGWTNNGISAAMTEVLASPVYNQTYHVSVRAQNGAGLINQFVSDGQVYLEGLTINEIDLQQVVVYPNPASDIIQVKGEMNLSLQLFDLKGKLIIRSNSSVINVREVATGSYHLMISSADQFVFRKIQIVR